MVVARPGVPRTVGRCNLVVRAASEPSVAFDRRTVLSTVGALVPAVLLPEATFAAKAPSGFNVCADTNDGYQFLYPFGWQEVAVTGVDVVFKDVIEPLESVSVTLIPTEKKDITEFGELGPVVDTLVKDVLTAPGQEVQVVNATEKEVKDRKYYEFEFTVKAPRYQRHSVGVVTVGNGQFYTLTTGASERRWGKMKDKLDTLVKSFALTY